MSSTDASFESGRSSPTTASDAAPLPLASREIRRWATSGGEVAVVELQDYEGGRRVVALRRWWRGRDGTLRPSRNGISFPLTDLDELEQALEGLRAFLPRAPEPEEPPEEGETVAEMPRHAPPRFPFPRIARPVRAVPPSVSRPSAPPVAAPGPVAPPAPPPPRAGDERASATGSSPRPESLLVAIFARGLVAAPLALRLDVAGRPVTGQAFSDGTVMFGNRRFASPREAVAVLRNQKHVVDAWHQIRFRNPKTNRFARLSRLRGMYHGMVESDSDESAG